MVFYPAVNSNNKRKSTMRPKPMEMKERKRVKNTRNKYLKPGAPAQLRYNRTRSCTVIGKKRVIGLDAEEEKVDVFHNREPVVYSSTTASPCRIDLDSMGDETRVQIVPATPKTTEAAGFGSSRLESLPMELLVKIMCHLHHDQLRAVFHVSQKVRTAVQKARQWHFNYTTPDRSRQEMLRTKTPLPTERWPFISKGEGNGISIPSPRTPKAPKHGPRPLRVSSMDWKPIAASLFQDTTLPSKYFVPAGRVLFYEDELCQAVAQNKLR